ncbi:MAG TPA: rhodanese-like domain-containing protein [Chloroflexota bacterium]|nr:rhodanese-like domain-containing protein [Chloroflexota bacterium]
MAAEEQQYAEPFTRIQPAEAKALIEGGQVTVVDVREGWEWANGHIPNAKHIPLAKIITAPAENLTSDNVIFVCEVGQRSAVAAEVAASLGKEQLYNLEGGTSAWRQAGYPVET